MKIRQYVNKSVIFAIGSSYDSIWRDFNSRLRHERVNFLQAMVLISLVFEENSGERVTPSKLAESFRTSRSNISHCVSHLEKAGFIKRTLDSGDARSYRLALKPEGRKIALRLIREIDELETFFEKRFGSAEVLSAIRAISGFERAYREKVTVS